MKNLIRVSVVVMAFMLLVPQVTFAAWWNPFSWNIFKGSEKTQIQQIHIATTTQNVATSTIKTVVRSSVHIVKKQIQRVSSSTPPLIPVSNNENTPVTVTSPTPVQVPQQDPALKIAQCQAKRDSVWNSFTSQINNMITQATAEITSQGQAGYNSCMTNSVTLSGPATFNPNISSASQVQGQQTIQAALSQNCYLYQTDATSRIEQLKEKMTPMIDQAKSASDSQYLQCLNQ